MNVSEVMNKNVRTISPDTPLVEAAQKMRDGDFGVMPVCEGDKLVGMLTDRDITIRAAAESKDLKQTPVREAMTPDVLTCFEDDDIDKVTQLMSDRQIRRVPVLDRNKKIVGILSLGDMATANMASENAGVALSEISDSRQKESKKDQIRH